MSPSGIDTRARDAASALVQKYARARELADDRAFDSMVQRVKDTPKDRESVQLMRLQIDTEKWTLARKRPKKYGERLDVTVDASSLQPPQVIVQIVNAPQPKQIEDAEYTVSNGEETANGGDGIQLLKGGIKDKD